jgi:hypothetical protein
MSEVKVNKISPRTNCGTVQLGDSGDTITIPAGATIVNNGTQTGFGRTGTVNWDTTAKTASFTAVSGNGYFVNTTSGEITVTLPATPSAGDIVAVSDYAGTAATNNIIIERNGSNFEGGTENGGIATNRQTGTFVYVDATQGWIAVNSNDASFLLPAYISATGGTVTCCGDYKIHTFTGPGTFCVSCGGNPLGSTTIEVLAVGGGGGSGSDNGGGGAGGAVAHGLSIPISVSPYPIAIGAGGTAGIGNCSPYPSGAGRDQDGNTGSPTNFLGNIVRAGSLGKSIYHGVCASIPGPYSNGGGGGGTSGAPAPLTMTAVTGIVHPAISGYTVYAGNSGGQGCNASLPAGFPTTGNRAGGGAGAGTCQNGEPGNPTGGGNGGNGVRINICGGNYYWGGGGGGGTNDNAGGNGGLGGGGGGGTPPSGSTGGSGGGCALNPGTPSPGFNGGAGGANTGGGGGGAGRTSPCGANGGSGIVIIKYKYQ